MRAEGEDIIELVKIIFDQNSIFESISIFGQKITSCE